ASLYAGSAEGDPARGSRGRRPRRPPGHAAQHDARAKGLPLRAALRLRGRELRRPPRAAGRIRTGPVPGLQPQAGGTGMTAPLLSARDLRVTFRLHREGDMPWTPPRLLHAVSGVDFDLAAGETLGIVGESGCGKSTLARALIQMVPATGRVIWQGKTDLLALSPREMLKYRADIQMVSQAPLSSLTPRMTVGHIIAEPLRTHHPDLGREEVKARVKDMMDRVGLLPNQINRYPHEFSGGQCQRIGIARALIV